MKRLIRAALPLAHVLSGVAVAQSNIDNAHKFAWAENAGWSNWRDANLTLDGVDVGSQFLSGWIWFENVGWVTVGDGTPGGGVFYTNASGLEGFAWGEHIGWINFDTSPVGAQRAKFDAAAGRFRGYAWGENVGWINLDDPTHYVAVVTNCPDFDGDGDVDTSDFAMFAQCFAGSNNPPAASCPVGVDADLDDDGDVDTSDFALFAQCFGGANNPPPAGCPLGC
jgi:hypothetical protein